MIKPRNAQRNMKNLQDAGCTNKYFMNHSSLPSVFSACLGVM